MPFDIPATSPSPVGTPRRWVAVYEEGRAANRQLHGMPPSHHEAMRASSPPPTYAQVMGQDADPPPPYAEGLREDAAPRRLPPSRALPTAVANGPRSWRLRIFRRLHPETQRRELQKQLKYLVRTEGKLEAARNYLGEVIRRHEALAASGRVYCGAGLFDGDECSVISNAQQEYAHYLDKACKAQAAYAAQLDGSADPLSPG